MGRDPAGNDPGVAVWDRIRSIVRFLATPVDHDARGLCPVCGRVVVTAATQLYGTGGPLPIPRPIGELVGACQVQHGTTHSDDDVRRVRQERGGWI